MNTHDKACESKLKGFDGCAGTRENGVTSCGPCYQEYLRRNDAMRIVRDKENEELFEMVKALAVGDWATRPRLVTTTRGILGGDHNAEPRRPHLGSDGRVWLLERSNARRGAAIGWRGWHSANATLLAVSILDKKGNTTSIWESSTAFSTYDLRAKELADNMEAVTA